jgi:hypothetical protein
VPRSLAELAAEIAGQVGDLPPMQRADRIAEALRAVRPNADPDTLRRAASEAAGYTGEAPRGPRAPRSGGGRTHRPATRAAGKAGRKARKVGRHAVRQVGGSTFGRVFRSGLYLTGLYWLLRSAGVVESVAKAARTGMAWLMDPSLTFAGHPPVIPGTDATSASVPALAGRTRPREAR